MNHTLILDALLTHPNAGHIFDHLSQSIPPHIADQHVAAASQARALSAEILKDRDPTGGHALPASDIPEWLRLSALDAYTAWIAGTADTCIHAPHLSRPEPVLAAAYKPGLTTCHRCIHMFSMRRGSAEDRTCDGCGHICAGPAAGDGIHAANIGVGPLTFMYGVCERCYDDLPASFKTPPPAA